MGVLLRLFQVIPISWNFKYILHAHSHTALLGWIYIGITSLIYHIFISKTSTSKLYKRIFRFTNICVIGMLFTFPFQGYAVFSIIFSTLFLFASYWFVWFALKHVEPIFKKRFSWKLIKSALWYLAISSIGPWAIGGVMATLGPTSVWYKSSIYFYLHFQYNAWFIFALLGFLFYVFEEKNFVFDPRKLKLIYTTLHIGVILSLFLSVLWTKPPAILYFLGGIGAIFQIISFLALYVSIKNHFHTIKTEIGKNIFFLIQMSGVLTCIKLIMQLLSTLPYFSMLSFVFNDFIIGYLHLVLLGIVTSSLIVFLYYFKLLRIPKTFLVLFLIAFFSTEILIFYKAIAFWLGLPFFNSYYLMLALLSCLFPIAIAILFFENIRGFSLKDSLIHAGTKFISFYRP